MITWHIGKKVELEPAVPAKEEIKRVKSCYYVGDNRGTQQHDIEIGIGIDGHLFFCEPDSWDAMIYLYPEQVKQLKKLLAEFT